VQLKCDPTNYQLTWSHLTRNFSEPHCSLYPPA